MPEREPNPPAPVGGRRLILLAVGALGGSCVMTQLALMRELLGAFSGNELVLGVVMGNWLLLMGLGTWIGRASQKFRRPLAALIVIQILVAILPLLQVGCLRLLRNAVFVRGAEVGVTETVASTFVLLLPFCVVAGVGLTLACSLLAPQDGPRGIGRVYIADSLGSIAGGVLFSFVLVRFLDHAGILVFPAVLNLLVAALIGLRGNESQKRGAYASRVCRAASRGAEHNDKLNHRMAKSQTDEEANGGTPLAARETRALPTHKLLASFAGVLAVAVVTAALVVDFDAVSTAWQYPRQHIVARANSPYGKLLVTESDGQFNFIENGIPLTCTRDEAHVEETVLYALAQRPDARTALLVGGGISGTAKELLKCHLTRVDYVELDPLILELGRRYVPENLADARLRILNTDGRLFIRHAREKYDLVILDLPAPATAQLNRFFTVEFWADVKRVLAPTGVVSFGLGHYENYVSPELARMLACAGRSLQPSFAHVTVLPGGQVFFLASDGPLFGDIAARLDRQGVKATLMNRHYLDAMLTPDRLMDMQRALAQPAAPNTDFSPALYYYHLRHWMSQFTVGFGALQALLLLLLGLYLVRLRGAALVLFASGFAATALEVVLLLAFQVLCGSVYHQVGIIVTVFMAGLALGALLANRRGEKRSDGVMECWVAGPAVPAPSLHHSITPPLPSLPLLAFAVAGYALLLALLLPRAAALASSLWLSKLTIALLTLILALLVGMQFPLANRLEFDGTANSASRLYTSDLIGAFLGALLASTLLIPLLGVVGVCLLTAGLNLLGGAVFQLRKRPT